MEPNPAQAGGFRLRVKMQLVRSSLWIRVAETSIGFISAEHLQVGPSVELWMGCLPSQGHWFAQVHGACASSVS